MITCSKLYSDIPFAHRQHKHTGHCRFIHGHNWGIKITFVATHLDENGFVIDFGRLKFIKQWIDNNLDHALLLNEDDPERVWLTTHLIPKDTAKILTVPDGSAEGLAIYFHKIFNAMVQEQSGGRVHVARIEVLEDQKNSASYHG